MKNETKNMEEFMIRENLRTYIENVVLKEYDKNESGHGIKHIRYVIKRSLEFAEQCKDINVEMVYTIAAYHDIGHHIDAKNHEKVSAEMLEKDEKLKEFFSDEEIKIMKEAVEDHRASSDHEPRSIYGKIVSSADRGTDIKVALMRTYSYNLKHNPQPTQDAIIEECRLHMIDKFGKKGYATEKMFFKDEEYSKYLDEMDRLANNKEEFYKTMREVIGK